MTANVNLLQSERRLDVVSLDSARAIASDYINRVEQPEDFDAEAVLRERPELWAHKSVVLDLAYEEFLRKVESGQPLLVSQFAARFPKWQASLQRMLQVHDFLDASPELAALHWPQAGDEFAGFQLREELGRGAFSRVFLASDPEVGGRSVVVKAVAKVHSDADTLGRLEHPYIVPIFSVSRDDAFGLTAICMPYLGRTTLYDVLQSSFGEDDTCPQQGIVFHEAIEQANQNAQDLQALRRDYPFSGVSYVDAVLEIAIQLSEALKYVHRRGIYHCDIKPSNVLFTAAGEAKLFDFNLAVAEDATTEQVGGTLAYMAPELLSAFTKDRAAGGPRVDARTDIFSLGVMLYELLTGKLPFDLPRDIDDRRELARHLLQKQAAGPVSLVKTNQAVSGTLAGLVERCLEVEPAARHMSAADLLESLLRERTRRRQASRRRFMTKLVGCGLGLGAASTAALAYTVKSESPLEEAREAFKAGRYDEAVKAYERAVSQDSSNVEVRFEFGNALLSANDFDKALKQYTMVRRDRKDSAEVSVAILRTYFYMGRSHASYGEFSDALDAFNQAAVESLRISNARPELMVIRAYQGLCLAHRSSKSRGPDYRAAIQRLRECLKVASLSNAANHNNLGYCLRKQRLDASERESVLLEAKSNFETAISKNETLRAPYLNLAHVCLQLCEGTEDEKRIERWLGEGMSAVQQAVALGTGEKKSHYEVVNIAMRGANLAAEKKSNSADRRSLLSQEYAKQAGLGQNWLKDAAAPQPMADQVQAGKSFLLLEPLTLDPLIDCDESATLGVLSLTH